MGFEIVIPRHLHLSSSGSIEHYHVQGNVPHKHEEQGLTDWRVYNKNLPDYERLKLLKPKEFELLERLYNRVVGEFKFRARVGGLREDQWRRVVTARELLLSLNVVKRYLECYKESLEDNYLFCPECGSDLEAGEYWDPTTEEEYYPYYSCSREGCNWVQSL